MDLLSRYKPVKRFTGFFIRANMILNSPIYSYKDIYMGIGERGGQMQGIEDKFFGTKDALVTAKDKRIQELSKRSKIELLTERNSVTGRNADAENEINAAIEIAAERENMESAAKFDAWKKTLENLSVEELRLAANKARMERHGVAYEHAIAEAYSIAREKARMESN